MSWLGVPLRLARREVRRRPGRTALVALLVAIPVAGMAIAVILIRSEAETPLEDWEQEHGQADAFAQGFDPAAPPSLPTGSRTVEVEETFGRLKTVDGQRTDVTFTSLPIGDPITTGIYDLVGGRPANAPGEVVLTPALADELGLAVGDTLLLEQPDVELEVVGEAERLVCLSCHDLLVASDVAGLGAGTAAFEGYSARSWLVDLPDGLPQAQLEELHARGNPSLSVRDVAIVEDHYEEVPGREAVRWSLVLGGLVLVVVGIVISAAFAVGARRQLVNLGQLSASGAAPSTIHTALVLQGTVTGLVGAAAGLAFAAVVLLAAQDRIEGLLDQRLRGYEARPVELLAVVLIGVAAATGSALIPARTAARIPTLAALAGRRPLAPVSRRLVTWGATSVVGGLGLLFLAVFGSQRSGGDVWAFVAIAGGVLELLGACALAPAIVSRLEPLSARLRGSLRLGARTLARHRARTGAVVSAVAAASALAVVAGSAVLGLEQQDTQDLEIPDDVVSASTDQWNAAGVPVPGMPVPESVEAELEDAFPQGEHSDLRSVFVDPGSVSGASALWEVVVPTADDENVFLGSDRALLADEAVLDAIRADDEVLAALDEHGVVLLDAAASGGEAVIRVPDGREVAGTVVPHPYELGVVGNLLVTPEAASDLGATVTPDGRLVRLPEPLTEDDRATLGDLSYDLSSTYDGESDAAYVQLSWHYLPEGPSPLQVELILSAVALVFCLFVVGVSLALAAAEGKDERDILTIAGAPPAAVSRSAGARAWFMSTLGAAIAIPIGFLPIVVVSWATGHDPDSSGSFPVVFPTRTALLLLVVVPLTVCVVAWMASATAQRIRPVRISTATFE